ncbi:MAG: hypothetical protein IJT98_06965 [Prevotella sp.]|nr:hypothetical protein [Prevotella sp.]
MPSFKNLEMAGAVSVHNNISIKKSLFSTKVVYTPTQSPVKIIIREYAPAEGERLGRLLNLPLDKMETDILQKGAPKPTPVGHFRLEVCLSEDSQFCAMQLFCFVDFNNSPVSEPHFYEGSDVATIVKLLLQ